MRHVIEFVFLACTLPSEFALAETYRCIMNHEISIRTNGSVEDNKEAAKGVEFFIAIDNKTQKGTFNICSESGCFKNAGDDVNVISRWEPDKTSQSRGVRFTRGVYQLWSLDGRKDTSDFTAAAVGFSGLGSSTSFGSCRLIIQ